MKTAATYTERDAVIFRRIDVQIKHLRKDTDEFAVANGYAERSSEWQFQASVVRQGITNGRIRRLVALGLLESKPSDGHGPMIRVNPSHRIYL